MASLVAHHDIGRRDKASRCLSQFLHGPWPSGPRCCASRPLSLVRLKRSSYCQGHDVDLGDANKSLQCIGEKKAQRPSIVFQTWNTSHLSRSRSGQVLWQAVECDSSHTRQLLGCLLHLVVTVKCLGYFKPVGRLQAVPSLFQVKR